MPSLLLVVFCDLEPPRLVQGNSIKFCVHTSAAKARWLCSIYGVAETTPSRTVNSSGVR